MGPLFPAPTHLLPFQDVSSAQQWSEEQFPVLQSDRSQTIVPPQAFEALPPHIPAAPHASASVRGLHGPTMSSSSAVYTCPPGSVFVIVTVRSLLGRSSPAVKVTVAWFEPAYPPDHDAVTPGGKLPIASENVESGG